MADAARYPRAIDGGTSTRRPIVSVVVVTYNNADEVARCLRAAHLALARLEGEVVVLDNASADDTIAVIEHLDVPVRLVRSPENLGFARGVNAAAAQARGEHLLLLNPDTELRPDAVEVLLRFAAERPRAGIIGGRTVRPDGTPHIDSCWAAPSLLSMLTFASGLSTAFPRTFLDPESMGRWMRDTEREVDTITGLLLLVRRDLWQQLGGFDERFFMYGEDVDLGIRVRQLGYAPRICPDAVVVHEGGRSTPDGGARTTLQLKGRVTLMDKHWSRPRATTGKLLLVTGVLLRAAAGRLLRPASAGAQRWLGAWRRRREWLQGFPELPPPADRVPEVAA